jgi:hypothetical protein
MKRTPTNLFLLSGVILIAGCSFNKNVVVKSPDGVNKLDLKENPLKKNLNIIRTESISYDKTWINTFGEKREIPDNYNEIKIFLENDEIKINFICRAS